MGSHKHLYWNFINSQPHLLKQNFGFLSFSPTLSHLRCVMRCPMGSWPSPLAWWPWCYLTAGTASGETTVFPHSHGYRRVPAHEHHCSADTYSKKPTPLAFVAPSSPSFPSTERPFAWVTPESFSVAEWEKWCVPLWVTYCLQHS